LGTLALITLQSTNIKPQKMRSTEEIIGLSGTLRTEEKAAEAVAYMATKMIIGAMNRKPRSSKEIGYVAFTLRHSYKSDIAKISADSKVTATEFLTKNSVARSGIATNAG
jgi:hypothetical protein